MTDLDRRQLLHRTAALGLLAASSGCSDRSAASNSPPAPAAAAPKPRPATSLVAPGDTLINVAFVISEDAVVIDFCGPWEVFQDTRVPGRKAGENPFNLYTVAETTAAIHASGGMQIVPTYSIADAPKPNVIVIPAQSSRSPRLLDWIRTHSKTSDVTMSVCTGAFVLAAAGLLAGKRATTYHGALTKLAMEYADITVERGARFVEDGNIASAGGLSSGIDLALRVVERYFGREIAEATAYDLEYQGQGWKDAHSNAVYARPRAAPGHVLCAVCEMDVDPATAPNEVYAGKTYYFCSADDQRVFDAAPSNYVPNPKRVEIPTRR